MYIYASHIIKVNSIKRWSYQSKWSQVKQSNSVTVIDSSKYPLEIDSETSCLPKFQYLPFQYLVAFSATSFPINSYIVE